MDHFGSHFGVHFGSLFDPFWCLNSGVPLGSSRVVPGLHLGSISGAFLDQIEQKVVQETGPAEHVPMGWSGAEMGSKSRPRHSENVENGLVLEGFFEIGCIGAGCWRGA